MTVTQIIDLEKTVLGHRGLGSSIKERKHLISNICCNNLKNMTQPSYCTSHAEGAHIRLD